MGLGLMLRLTRRLVLTVDSRSLVQASDKRIDSTARSRVSSTSRKHHGQTPTVEAEHDCISTLPKASLLVMICQLSYMILASLHIWHSSCQSWNPVEIETTAKNHWEGSMETEETSLNSLRPAILSC